jgi:hypothetical protein
LAFINAAEILSSSVFLYFNAYLIKEFRSNIRPVGPLDGARVRVDRHLRKEIGFLERLKNLTVQFPGKISLAPGA